MATKQKSKKTDYIFVGINFEQELLKKIDDYAEKEQRDRSSSIRWILQKFFEKGEK